MDGVPVGSRPNWTQMRHATWLPLSHPLRIREHCDKLFAREQRRAMAEYNGSLRCPCSRCGGSSRPRHIVDVIKHLEAYGRHPRKFLWDVEDEEWRAQADTN